MSEQHLYCHVNWMPVTQQNRPKKDGQYLLTIRHLQGRLAGTSEVIIDTYRCKFGSWQNSPYSLGGEREVTAWAPLPEPYKGV